MTLATRFLYNNGHLEFELDDNEYELNFTHIVKEYNLTVQK